jgi:uncharacterized protein (DUF362 family)
MANRREVLKGVAMGAMLLGTEENGLAGMMKSAAESSAKPRVILATDKNVRGGGVQPDEKRVLDLLDKAIATYTGHNRPVESWKQILGSAKRVTLKVNMLGGKGLCTHPILALAVCERIQQAGIQAGDIIIWDRNTHELERNGYTVSMDKNKIRCFGNDAPGYGFEESSVSFGKATVHLAKILTRESDMVINMPILKDHGGAGITFAMKNMYGVVQKPNELHGGNCSPYVADLNRIPEVREKVRFTVGDALTACYNGGPGFKPEFVWEPNSLLVGADRVALDYTAWQWIEQKRAEMKMPTLAAANRSPKYIAVAADAEHQLGVADPRHFSLLQV